MLVRCKLIKKNFAGNEKNSIFAPQMEKNEFKIDLLGRGLDGSDIEYTIGDSFFDSIDGLVRRGQLHTTVHVTGNADTRFRFLIHSVGVVYAPCDRCLADVEVPVDTEDEISVMLGDEYADDGDVIVVPEKDGMMDLSQIIYEFIALSLPLKLVHEPGNCDEAMIATLEEHLSARSGEDSDEEEQ